MIFLTVLSFKTSSSIKGTVKRTGAISYISHTVRSSFKNARWNVFQIFSRYLVRYRTFRLALQLFKNTGKWDAARVLIWLVGMLLEIVEFFALF